jgi:hypothetical protein
MKKGLLLSTALVFGTVTLASAGGMGEPVMTTEVVEESTSSSTGDIIVPLLLLLVIAAAASGSAGGSGGGLSDIRLKEDISLIGMTPQGLPLYRYRYKGLPEVWQGVMAQDVAMVRPDAIIDGPFGYMAVDYAKLGLKMRRVH